MQKDSSANAKLQTINQVEGFDPTEFAVEFTDLNTKKTRQRLPVMTQMGWFRLVYPKGKIAVTTQYVKDFFVAHARVYVSYEDPAENFLAEATASRGHDPQKPTVSPREWAQTAAIGIALRNAGFGLQMDAAGDGFDQFAVNEGGGDIQFTQGAGAMNNVPAPAVNDAPFDVAPQHGVNNTPSAMPFPEPQVPGYAAAAPEPAQPAVQDYTPPAASAETPAAPTGGAAPQPGQPVTTLEQAMRLPCPIKAYAGKTLGDVLQIDAQAILWVAEKFSQDPVLAAGARLICDHAQGQASA